MKILFKMSASTDFFFLKVWKISFLCQSVDINITRNYNKLGCCETRVLVLHFTCAFLAEHVQFFYQTMATPTFFTFSNIHFFISKHWMKHLILDVINSWRDLIVFFFFNCLTTNMIKKKSLIKCVGGPPAY